MAPDSSRKRLPFEPTSKGKGADNKSSGSSLPKPEDTQDNPSSSTKVKATKSRRSQSSSDASTAGAIPEVVSRRMLRRMLAFSGIPTALGVVTFFASYFLLVNDVVELPSYFVLFATLGCFGLGVVGLTYGVLSASWEENRPGHWFGWDEFQVNFGRMRQAWGSKADS
ncbi:PAM68 family protein [Nodosilinea sp. P-1105]|uniref:PAM68 family protein n=1 Tax=Nodosilinea sp. P-1105 TaxID=2546229 RepID=UPI00146F62C8|nr:PAM68 family protein [Nodosilinea sp. P-1105]NMF83825.1 DUF3464 family protein [Nodosilinea sp. P-1105]